MSQVRQVRSLERAGSAEQAAKKTASEREDRTRGDLWPYLYREEASALKGIRSPGRDSENRDGRDTPLEMGGSVLRAWWKAAASETDVRASELVKKQDGGLQKLTVKCFAEIKKYQDRKKKNLTAFRHSEI